MKHLSRQASKGDADKLQLHAEARRVTDAYLTQRLKNIDLSVKHQHLDKHVARLKKQTPLVAAFVEQAEAPRRRVEERCLLRARANSSADAVLTGNPSPALAFFNARSRRNAIAAPPEAAGDIPRLLACGTLLKANRLDEAIVSAGALLKDLACRSPAGLVVEPVVVRALLGLLLERLDRCDRLYAHRVTDKVVPLVRELVCSADIFTIDEKGTQMLSAALTAAADDANAYDVLHTLALRLHREDNDAAPLVRLLADVRLKDAYWRLSEDDDLENAPASLTPDAGVKWAFTKLCENALKVFYQRQSEAHRAAFNSSAAGLATRFEDVYFNAELCLRALDHEGLLCERSDLQVIAMLHYFVEELDMVPQS